MSDTSYTDSGDDTQADFTRNFPDPGLQRKPPNGDIDPGIVNPPSGLAPGFARDASGRLTRNGQPPDTMFGGGIPGWREPRSPMAGPHPADSNWDRFLFALSGPESSFGRNQANPTSSARGWLQDIAGTRNQMIRQGLGDPWAGGRQNQFAVNRRYIERNFPQAAQAIARGDWNTAIRILAPNQWPSLPGGPQSTPQGIAMFNRALQRGPPQAFLGNPYPASPSDYGQPDSILKTAQSTPGLGPPGYMPQPNELTGVLQQAMSGLMQNGSGRISPMSLATMQFYANYLIAQRKGQTEAAKIQHARFQDQFKETLDAQQIELSRMGSCFSEAEKSKDPIGEFKECMAAYPDSPNDPALQRALQGPNSWAQIKALLDWRHDNWLKGSKVKSQSDKQAGPDPYDDTTTDGGDSTTPSTTTPSTTPSPQLAPSTAAPTAQPATPTQAPAPLSPNQAPPGSQSTHAQLATDISMGQEAPTGGGKPTERDIAQANADAERIHAQLNAIASNNALQGPAVVDAVRGANGQIGNDLQDVIDFGPSGSRTSGMATSPRGLAYQRILETLARKADPQWTPQRAGDQANFRNQNGRTQQTLARASTMYQAGLQVAEDLARLPPDTNLGQLRNKFASWLETKQGDPRYTTLFGDWLTYNQDLNVLNRGGAPSVQETGERQRMIDAFSGTAAQFRGALAHEAGTALSRINHYTGIWQSIGGKGIAYGVEDRAFYGLRGLTLMNDKGNIRGSPSLKGQGPPVVGQVYSDGRGGSAVFTAAGRDPRNLRDPANWEEY